MENQEQLNAQQTQEEEQNLNEEQLDGVTGAGLGSLAGKIGKCFGCGKPSVVEQPVHQLDLSMGHPTPGRRNNNPALSQNNLNTEVRNMKQKLQDWVNK